MFEYINPGFVLLGSIVSVMIFLVVILITGKAIKENRKTKAPILWIAIIVLLVSAVIFDGINTKERIESSIAHFNRGDELQCSTLTTTYLVSKSSGWRYYKKRLNKDSLLLDVKFCEE